MEKIKKLKDLFYNRTLKHLELVRKYIVEIMGLKDDRIDNFILRNELINHDNSKFQEPEFYYYLHINYKYYLKGKGTIYDTDKKTLNGMKMASYHHVKYNKHHPE